MHIRRTAPVVALLCLAISGCTTPNRGEPTPEPPTVGSSPESTSPPSGDNDLPSHGAPKVDNPLNTAAFQQDPCSALTASQTQQELNLPPTGEPDEITLGKGCEWSNKETRGEVKIGFLLDNHRGLSAFYDANQRGEYPYFIELPPVADHPAIASDIEDRRALGRCIVAVGVTDELVVEVILQLSQANVGKKDACGVAAQVAEMTMRTMKQGA
jgi:Protein of unknown function (DUF3558)